MAVSALIMEPEIEVSKDLGKLSVFINFAFLIADIVTPPSFARRLLTNWSRQNWNLGLRGGGAVSAR